jgi:hypothetical protein
VRNVRQPLEAVAILPRAQDIVTRHAAGWADGEIVHAHELADERAHRVSVRRELQPVVEHTAFVGFKVLQFSSGGNALESDIDGRTPSAPNCRSGSLLPNSTNANERSRLELQFVHVRE